MPKGYVAFVLHAHLPFIRHPEYESFLEERWFFEAMTETYIPLVKNLSRIAAEGVHGKITISLSPSLLSMMEDPLLQQRYLAHINKQVELAHKEQERNQHNGHFKWLAEVYERLFIETRDIYTGCDCRLSTRFKELSEAGCLELMTCTATHGALPILAGQPKSVRAQVKTGVEYFESVFGFRPQGLWLPECAYAPGIDQFLRDEGIRYFLVDAHGIMHASASPFYGVNAPIYTPSGVAAFGRDQWSTEEVWSSKKGFPGDVNYREFYRDIGFDLDYNYVHPYIAGDIRVDTGIKYYRITGHTSHKEPYNFEWARERAASHAGAFLHKRIGHISHISGSMKVAPVVVAPFDAELFGHWWFEGPMWLDYVMRKAAYDQDVLELTSPSAYLDRYPVHQMGVPVTSTWGHKGYFEKWVNGKTDWIYPQLYECGARMEKLAGAWKSKRPDETVGRALNQCMRELLLAQCSDWPFIIHNGTAEQYAVRRVKDHVSRFHFLADALEKDAIDETGLAVVEQMDNVFPKADWRVFG